MDDILLTDSDLVPILEAAVREWNSWSTAQKRTRPWAEYSRDVVCRAQVRKAREWLESNPETDIDAGTLIALRAAGEGK